MYNFQQSYILKIMYKEQSVCNCTIIIGTNSEMCLIRVGANTKKSLNKSIIIT